MYKYKGSVEVIICTHTHSTRVVPFYFEDSNQLTRDFVKLHVVEYLNKMNYTWVGIDNLTYEMEMV